MKQVVKEIGSGDSAIDKTVRKMWQLINRDVKNPDVLSKAKSLQGKSKEQTVKNIFDYVVNTFQYRSDPEGIEHFTAPVHLINKKFSKHLDCDDMVGILCALLTASKIPCRIKVIAWRRHDFTHVIAEAKYNGSWLDLDAVQGANGFGHTVEKIIRKKIYRNPNMGKLITLEDGPCCRTRNSGRGGRGDNINHNVISIGNQAYDVESGRYVDTPHQQKPPKPETKIVKEKIPVPYPVVKKVKTPIRVIKNEPVTVYREFY